jgi:hypothetical protein
VPVTVPVALQLEVGHHQSNSLGMPRAEAIEGADAVNENAILKQVK